MKIYSGKATADGTVVRVNGQLLKPRFDLRILSSESPCGPRRKGHTRLALAMLADLLNNDDQALNLYQPFNSNIIAYLPVDRDWILTEETLRAKLAEIS